MNPWPSTRRLLVVVSMLAAAGCAHLQPSASGWRNATQLVLVTTSDWNADHGQLARYLRSGSSWHRIGDVQPVMIGRAGAGWGRGLNAPQAGGPVKREGDGRSPAGVFGIGVAFGYAPTAMTQLPYRATQATDYCVDVSGSPLYNQLADSRVVGEAAIAGATEPMRRDLHADGDQRYRLGFVIAHNADAKPMAGSCIFAHLWKSPHDATTGCTAMAPDTMDTLLGWLRPDAHPVFVLLPASEYRRLQRAWDLPSPAN